jgi:endonuclease I
LFPTDGFVNFKRGNLPFGNVIPPIQFQSSNGAKIGKCRNNSRENCFEPSDEYKGDLARVYFYMAVRYMNEFRCCDKSSTNKSKLKPWLVNELKEWNARDPVSSKEKSRNNNIEKIQGNRNPFVDHPEWINQIDFSS